MEAITPSFSLQRGRPALAGLFQSLQRVITARLLPITLAAFGLLTFASSATTQAGTNQEDYLRRLSENVGGGSTDSGGDTTQLPHLLAFIVLIAGVITILIWWNARESKPKKIKHVNHSRKLLRQISREMGMAGDEIKQLKLLADLHERDKGQALENPLTLLLCPSLLTRSLELGDSGIDRQVVGRLARRISQKSSKAA